jgi:hypothetical protein
MVQFFFFKLIVKRASGSFPFAPSSDNLVVVDNQVVVDIQVVVLRMVEEP